MATYNAYLKGYIADVPRVVFKRCDGFKYFFDELTDATVSANIETIDVNAGWSLFPVAVLPGNSTFEMNFTVAKFDAGLFALANAVTEEKTFVYNADYAMSTGERYDVVSETAEGATTATLSVTLDRKAIAGTIYIPGLTENEDFTVEVAQETVGDKTVEKSVITFADAETLNGSPFVDVVYDYTQPAYETIITNKESAIGECLCIWPVYGSGDECTESAIIGYWCVRVFRARVSQQPGMNTSYKNAATLTELSSVA